MKYNKILIVDDSTTSRMIVRRCLEMAGFSDAEFLEAGDGAVALDLLHTRPVELIISDLKMPRMDGRTFVRKLHADPTTTEIPVLIVSSVAPESDAGELFEENVIGTVRKPLSPAKMMAALQE